MFQMIDHLTSVPMILSEIAPGELFEYTGEQGLQYRLLGSTPQQLFMGDKSEDLTLELEVLHFTGGGKVSKKEIKLSMNAMEQERILAIRHHGFIDAELLFPGMLVMLKDKDPFYSVLSNECTAFDGKDDMRHVRETMAMGEKHIHRFVFQPYFMEKERASFHRLIDLQKAEITDIQAFLTPWQLAKVRVQIEHFLGGKIEEFPIGQPPLFRDQMGKKKDAGPGPFDYQLPINPSNLKDLPPHVQGIVKAMQEMFPTSDGKTPILFVSRAIPWAKKQGDTASTSPAAPVSKTADTSLPKPPEFYTGPKVDANKPPKAPSEFRIQYAENGPEEGAPLNKASLFSYECECCKDAQFSGPIGQSLSDIDDAIREMLPVDKFSHLYAGGKVSALFDLVMEHGAVREQHLIDSIFPSADLANWPEIYEKLGLEGESQNPAAAMRALAQQMTLTRNKA